jgi:hypothetical protein
MVFGAGQNALGSDAATSVWRIFDQASLAEFDEVVIELALSPWAAPSGVLLGEREPIWIEPTAAVQVEQILQQDAFAPGFVEQRMCDGNRETIRAVSHFDPFQKVSFQREARST